VTALLVGLALAAPDDAPPPGLVTSPTGGDAASPAVVAAPPAEDVVAAPPAEDLAAGGGVQIFRVEVLPEPLNWSPDLTVRVHDSAEEPLVLTLKADPSRSGFLTVEAELPERRWRDVELVLDDETSLWRRVVPAERPDALTLSFVVDDGRGDGRGDDGEEAAEDEEDADPTATRVAWLPLVGSGPNAGNEVSLILAFGWGGLVFAYVAWLARRAPA